MGSLDGRTIAFLEARRSQEMAQLVERRGGTPYVAPALREVSTADSAEVHTWIRDLVAQRFDVVIFLTGVGCRAILEAAAADGQLDAALEALATARVVARGPKPAYVLKQHDVR